MQKMIYLFEDENILLSINVIAYIKRCGDADEGKTFFSECFCLPSQYLGCKTFSTDQTEDDSEIMFIMIQSQPMK